jgi:hypothetical protein
MKLMIVVNWYPPDERVPARRWGNLVHYLQKTGNQCSVISAGDGCYKASAGSSGEQLIRVPVVNGSRSRQGEIRKTRDKKLKQILRKIYRYAVPAVFNDINLCKWKELADQLPILQKAAVESDVIISSYGPAGPMFLGLILAKRNNKPWVLDIRDSFIARDGDSCFLSRRISRLYEKRILNAAAQRITVGAKLAEMMTDFYDIEFKALYNGWTDEDIIYQRNICGGQNYVYYAGTIYRHQLNAFRIILSALPSIPGLKLKIRLLNDFTKGAFSQLLEETNTTDRVEILQPVQSEIIRKELAEAFCALVVENTVERQTIRNGTVTGKLLGLLASGVPGIAVTSQLCEMHDLVENNTTNWFSVNNVEHCVGALLRINEQQVLNNNRDTLSHYHMKEQAMLLENMLNSIIQGEFLSTSS